MTSAENPYVGARPFTREQPLFGRDRERREIVDLLVAQRIVLLHAPSGAGKTSLIQGKGGVADTLRDEGFAVLPSARVGLPPSDPSRANRYADSLLTSLEQEAGGGTALDVSLRSLAAQRADAVGTVLIIDQFEEVLTVDPAGERQRVAFFEALGRALDDRLLWALFAMRDEYLGALAPYQPRIPTRLRTHYRIDLLEREAARQAIVNPARDAGVPFTASAAEKLVDELCMAAVPRPDGTVERTLGTSVEPVQLQLVCHRLWLRRDPAAKEITEGDVSGIDSVDAALSQYYASAVAGAARGSGEIERNVREWIERELITGAGVRSQVMRYGGRERRVRDEAVSRLVDAYILRQDTRRGVAWIELAHDRLIEPVWHSNAAWRREHLDVAQVQATLWEDRGRSEALCLRGEALAKAEQWARAHADDLTPIEAQFLVASRKIRDEELAEKARHQRHLSIAIAVAVIMMMLGGWAWAKKLEADTMRTAARDSSMMASARVLLTQNQPAWAMKLLLEVQHPEKREGWVDLANEVLNAGGLRMTVGDAGNAPAAAWSPDGKRIVATSDEHAIQVWNADGHGAPVALRGHTEKLVSAAWSPDGRRIVTASWDKTARVWNADGSGEPITLKGHTDAVVSAAWSPDGKRIVTASSDRTARVWNADGHGAPVVLRGHTEKLVSAAWSPDGNRIVTASWDKTARVWNADGSGEPVVLRGHTENVASAAWSPDGKRIVTASWDKTARVWNADGSGRPVILRGHTDEVVSAAWSPDGKRVVTASLDWTARVWNADGSGEPIILKGHTEKVLTAAWSPDGSRIVTASSDKTVRVQRVDGFGEPIVLRGHEGAVLSATWSPDATRIVTTSWDKTARVWDAGGSGEPITDVHGTLSYSAALSPDLERIALKGEDATVQTMNADGSGKPLVLRGHQARVRSVAWSLDGRKIVSASEDHTARVWNADGSGEPVILRGHTDAVLTAVFSPDGRRVVTGSSDRTARVWNADGSGEPVILRGHEKRVVSVAWGPDARKIITGSDDATARVWNADGSGDPIVLRGHTDPVKAVAFSPDGQKIVTGTDDNTARVWNADGSDTRIALRGHDAPVLSAVFSADGKQIVTGSEDTTTRVWNADGSGKAIILRGQVSPVAFAALIPEDRRVVTLSYEQAVKVWILPVPPLRRALETANADCLRVDLRVMYLDETMDRANERYDACERDHGRTPIAREAP